jgi:septal ring factor EnvC (AmiA/AmiB activator)
MTKSAENIEKKIEAQLEKLKQLKAQKQAIEAEKGQSKKNRKERMILDVKFCLVLI